MFDLVRFRRLLNAQWAEQWRMHAWFVAIAVMVHFVATVMLLSSMEPVYTMDAQMGMYVSGLVVTGPLFAARYFHAMARPESALLFLMRPASGFEKWLLALLMLLVLYPVAYSLAFQICHVPAGVFEYFRLQDLIAARVADVPDDNHVLSLNNYALWMPWKFPDWTVPALLMLLLADLEAFAVLGSLWFRRFPILKTALAAFLLLLASMALGQLFPRGAPWIGDSDLATAWWQQLHEVAYWFGIPVLLWLACYFAVRERELA